MSTPDPILEAHMKADSAFQTEQRDFNSQQLEFNKDIRRLLLGDDALDEMGMKQKTDTMYDILVQAKGISGFFGSFRNVILFFVAIGTLIAIIKGWFYR